MKDSVIGDDRIKFTTDALKQTFHLTGDTAELGVYEGGMSRHIALNNNNAIHHAYDTFEGMPEDDVFLKGHHKGDFPVDFDYVLEVLNLPNIRIHKGFFPHTAVEAQFKFVHIDVDIYQSTRAGLGFFVPRMVKGGIIVMDDLDYIVCPGVRKACEEMGLHPDPMLHFGGILRF